MPCFLLSHLQGCWCPHWNKKNALNLPCLQLASSFSDRTAVGKSEVLKLKCFEQAGIFQELPWEGCYDLVCSHRKYSTLEINSAHLGESGRYKITKPVSFCNKHKPQIDNLNSQPCILYSGLHSLNKSIFPMIKMSRCVIPVTKRLPQITYFILYFPWGAPVKIHKHNPTPQHLSHPHMMPLTAFCWYFISFFLPDDFRAISNHLDINCVIAISMGYQVDFWKFCLWKEDSC